MKRSAWLLGLAGLLATASGLAQGPLPSTASDPAAEKFFETKVRPVLAEHCFKCHGPEKQKVGLRLDSRAAILKGGDSGPAVRPGQPQGSLLIDAINYGEVVQMPPTGKLPPQAIADVTAWVRIGAPWPERKNVGEATTGEPSVSSFLLPPSSFQHWAFQPPQKSPLPSVQRSDWPQSPIDFFILAPLETKGLAPAPPADRRTLIRRATFDLIGLPPTFEEVEAFAQDPAPDAWSKVVDRLLASPHYGERWGRHWLDAARYSDTRDAVLAKVHRNYPYAYTYRDYVIAALNEDKPYDRFLLEQLAADKLDLADTRSLAALGFLTVGRRFEDIEHLIVDDRIDTVTRGLMALTVACARCHDHKFDPIPTSDYYSLYGIFASAEEPLDLPEIGRQGSDDKVRKHLAKRDGILSKYEAHIDKVLASFDRDLRDLATEYLRYVAQTLPNHRTIEGFVPLDTPRGLLRRGVPARWQAWLDQAAQQRDPAWSLWGQFAALKRDDFAKAARLLVDDLENFEQPLHPWVRRAFRERPPQSMDDVADVYGELVREALESVDPAGEPFRAVFAPHKSPVPVSRAEMEIDLRRYVTEFLLTTRQENTAAKDLRIELEKHEEQSPLERAMALRDGPRPCEARIFIRGNPQQPGTHVPRRFLQVLAPADRNREYAGSGRLELARAVASRDNPLTARVLVNRVWQHHFGQALVRTPDDFGTQGERPSHPELLDLLAVRFVDSGWSTKALHRLMMLSSTYRMSSIPHSAIGNPQSVDPENRLLWRMNRTRLEFEPLRDALLAVAGRLDQRRGGPGETLGPAFRRRAVYAFIDRFEVPAALQTFDVAPADASVARRAETTVPQQALFLMNDPFVAEQAEALAAREAVRSAVNVPARIDALYRLVLSRRPDAKEMAFGLAFLGNDPAQRRWVTYAQTLLLSNEFMYVD